ncbi:MAG TPA: hypothetical protein VN873_16680 [Candidatus Angelobacter sp.]|nr:hypothetical protein [Candidatus Angelobacter sp.]
MKTDINTQTNIRNSALLLALILQLTIMLHPVHAAGFATATSAGGWATHGHFQQGTYYIDETMTNTSFGDSTVVMNQSSSTHTASANWQDTSNAVIDGLTIPWQDSMAASSYATVSGGSLHLYAQGHAKITPTSFSYIDSDDNPNIVYNPYNSESAGFADAFLGDTITVTSATLAAGSPVDLLLTVTMHDNVSGTPGGGAEAECFLDVGESFSEAWQNYEDGRIDGTLVDNISALDGSRSTYGVGALSSSNAVVVHTVVGASLTVNLHASASTGAIASAQTGNSEALGVADVGNTVFLNLDPLTPGTGYTTASGFSYLTLPVLKIAPKGNLLVISWPESAAVGFTLQTNGDLTAPNWNDYGGTISTNGGTESVTINPQADTLFFRLAH